MDRQKLRTAAPCALVLVSAVLLAPAGCSDLFHNLSPNSSESGDDGGVSSSSGGPITFDGSAPVVDGAPPSGTPVACTDSPYSDPWTPGYSISDSAVSQVKSIVPTMSITDLAGQMRGTDPGGESNYNDIFRTLDNPQVGVRGFKFRDGPRGACLAAQLPHGQLGYATAFPVPESRAAAFDMGLEEQIGEAIGDEVLASGNTLVLAPVINILRNPLWGRAQETYGEDSFVLGRLGSAFVVGAQNYIPACAKHYAAYNVEDGRASNNAQLDEQTLREHYTRHFGVVIQDSGVSCIMSSYNLVNGTKASLHQHLLTDILRSDFGFQGFILTDWWAMPPGNSPTTTDALQAGAIAGVKAGLTMELPWSYNYAQLEAVSGPGAPLTQAQLVADATLILREKYRFNVGDLNSTNLGLKAPSTSLDSTGSIVNNEAHVALAQQAALEGMVLLKNDGNTLPIPGSVHNIAVVGAKLHYNVVNTDNATGDIAFATDLRLGDLGSSRVFSDPAKSSGPAAGIQAAAPAGVTVVSGTDASVAANADFIVAVVGLTPQDEGEEYTGAGDRQTLALDGKASAPIQDPLVTQLAALGKPMVVVIEAGSVIDMPWLSQVKAVVMAWYPGQQGGAALGQLLFGKASFSGKLPFTWPAQLSDEPAFSQGNQEQMGYYVGYQYFDNMNIKPLYPFGHGLSYTTFQYENLFVPCSTVTQNGVVNVTADIQNTGTMAGAETAFLFVSYPNAPARRPAKELKGFFRVTLAPGETRRVTFPIRVADLKYWDSNANAWAPPSGAVNIMVGPSSDNLPLTGSTTVQ